jgi:hypothetical protein
VEVGARRKEQVTMSMQAGQVLDWSFLPANSGE